MRTTIFSNAFKKDFKRCLKRGQNTDRLETVVALLEEDKELPTSCRPHKLRGEYQGYWECHIAPDWLLIYEYPDDEHLVLYRTGTHTDLFK